MTVESTAIPASISAPILDAVAATFNVTRDALLGRRRSAHVARARQAAYWLLRKRAPSLATLAEIGALFGKDHTTVLYGVREAEARARAEVSYALLLADAWQRLGE